MKRVPVGQRFYNPAFKTSTACLVHAIDTGGLYAQLDFRTEPFAGRSTFAESYHPTYTEKLEIMSGAGSCSLNGKIIKVKAGDVIEFRPGDTHLHPWSESDEELHIIQTTSSAVPDADGIDTQMHIIAILAYLARQQKTDSGSIPGIFQLALMMDMLMPSTYVKGIPPLMQRVFFRSIAGMGKMLGYKAWPSDDLLA
jgi:mannose-6-phosphate isomerase-like protein (cupin superfamily)